MKTEWVLRQKAFDTFLAWLDTDRDRAGEKYEEIRRKLIEHLSHRGCFNPEELTDEVIDRVIQKVPEIAGTDVDDPMAYFYAEARRVFFVYRGNGLEARPIAPRETEEVGRVKCVLRKGTRQMRAESRELTLNQ